MSIPKGVPQSPTWFRAITSWPKKRSTRARASPITVERRCPTCISLATFGRE